MSRLTRLWLVVLLSGGGAFGRAAQDEAPARPNLMLILCDDLGYADIGAQGAKHATPSLDRMAAEGVRFTSFYSAANVCTPTRASIMTGCYPRRVGLHENESRNWVLFPGNRRGLNPKEVTLAELLKQRGYRTACIGKWHLGDQPEFLPTRHGFDYYFGVPYSNDMGRTERPNSSHPPLPLLQGELVVETEPDQRLLTKRYTEEALRFIQQNARRPFFLYLAHNMPHWPQFAGAPFAGKSGNGRFGDAVTEIDWSTGEILAALRRLGLEEKTLVVFTSDNGGPTNQGACNLPLRGAKGSNWEGGHRVPFVARWPGRVPAGRVSEEIGASFDLYTTFALLAGARLPASQVIDGKDLWPLLAGQPGAKSPHRAFYYYHVGTLAAVRAGPWKLFVEHEVAPQGKPDNKRPVAAALYNLAEDLSESRNVAAEHPEVVQSLSRLAEEARQDLGDGARLGRHSRPPGEVKTPRTLAPVDRPVPTLRVMSYNIHHGEGADGRVDLARIAELVRSEKPDLVALQEVDKGVARTQRRDLPAELAALTGMTCLFTNNFHYQGGEYGNAVLARHPVRNWTNRRLKMLRAGEQRGVMQVVVQVAGRELMFMNTHIDYRRDDAERLQNVEEFKEIIQGCRMPVVFCGDFNDPPGSRTYQAMSTDFDDAWVFAGVGNGYTITSRQPQKRIDYIWLRKGASLIPVRVWVPRTEASDHLPVVAELQLR